MIEFDVDMGYLLEEGELDCVVLNDENGEHEPIMFWPHDKSRYTKLFGTPEKAARTLDAMHRCSCDIDFTCDDCPMLEEGLCVPRYGNYESILGWLECDAE